MRIPSAVLLATVVPCGLAAQTQNTTLLQHFKRTSSSTKHNDVWGMTTPEGREYAIFGEGLGITILDATNPRNLRQVGFYSAPGGSGQHTWRDFTNVGRFFYAVSEQHRGIRVLEVLQNGAVRDHGYKQTATVTKAHNVRSDPDTGLLYVLGGNNYGMAIFDAGNHPTDPKFLSVWRQDYVHDACIYKGRAYVCNGKAFRTRILDIRNPFSLPLLGECHTSSGYNHAAWVSEDEQLLVVGDEIARNGVTPHMTVWDIRDVRQPKKVGDYDPGGGAIAHNIFMIGRGAYMSYYVRGFHLVDMGIPSRPELVAAFDSSTERGGYAGNWGVYPFQDSGTIYMSDMQNGFYAVQVDCGHMNRYGTGTAGSRGVPRARFDGTLPRVGRSQLKFDLANLEPGRAFWIVVAAGKAAQTATLLGAEVEVDIRGAAIVGPLMADSDGEATIPAPIPNNPALANSRVHLQVFCTRPNGTLSASRGMWSGICR